MKDKPRLCIDARMLYHSGIGTYLRMLLPYICAEFEVTLLGNAEQLKLYNATASVIQFNAPIYSIEEQRRYRQIIPPVDLFWSPHYNVPLTGIRAHTRVATIHDVFHLAFFNQLSLKQKVYAKLVINRAVSASDGLITVSNFSKNEILKYTQAKPEKISVIYNGVQQVAAIANSEDIAIKYKLPSKYILYVGNVKPHKNLKGLVSAYLRLPLNIQQEYKIVVAGKTDGFITGDDALFALINDNQQVKEKIIFTGFVDDKDMDAIYTNASLFIFPSLYEGFGLPPLEAMLNKCPVLVSNQNSLPEICGDAAAYFDPNDPNDIARQIKNVVSDKSLSKSLVMKGTGHIKLFTWANCAVQHIELFNRIIQS